MSFAGAGRLDPSRDRDIQCLDDPLSNWWTGLTVSVIVAFVGMVIYMMITNPAPIPRNTDVNTTQEQTNTALMFHNQRVLNQIIFRR